MHPTGQNKVLVESLVAMRNSLQSSYDMKTNVTEESLLLDAFRKSDADYVVFSDYRRNEGKKRIEDALEIIDNAVSTIEEINSKEAARLYLQTLKSVAKISRMASVLEHLVAHDNKEKEEDEGILALKSA